MEQVERRARQMLSGREHHLTLGERLREVFLLSVEQRRLSYRLRWL